MPFLLRGGVMSKKSAVSLVVFDLDDTTTKGNAWQQLNLTMGVTTHEDNLYYDLYAARLISYQEWLDKLLVIYRTRANPTKATIMQQLLRYTYLPGARETIGEIKQLGYEVAIISGAMDMFVSAVAKDLQISTFAYNTKLHFDADKKLHRAVARGEDRVVKLQQLSAICKEKNISLEQCLCVGDGENDRLLFEATGRGVTFQHCKSIHDCSWRIIQDWPSLLPVLQAL